jgi:hypothetical protein
MAPDPDSTQPARPTRRTMVFRKRRTTAPPTPGQARRQSEIVQSAWRHFGESAQPLHLAIESDEGFERVTTLLEQMSREA